MKSILDNLVLYEIVLLFLGILLFVILSGGLIYYIVKKEEIKKLLAFFVIPIIMIAYPSIKEIQIGDNIVKMKEQTEEVLKNPNDSTAIKSLAKATKIVEKRATTFEDISSVSQSYYVLGDSDKAIFYADKALQLKIKTKKTSNLNKEKDKLKKDSVKPDISNTTKQNIKIAKLKNIKVLANIEKDIKKDPTLLKDSIRLSKKLKKINTIDKSKTYQYFTRKRLNTDLRKKSN